MYAVRIVNVPNLVPRAPSTKEKGDLTKVLSTCIRIHTYIYIYKQIQVIHRWIQNSALQ